MCVYPVGVWRYDKSQWCLFITCINNGYTQSGNIVVGHYTKIVVVRLVFLGVVPNTNMSFR